MRCLRLSEHVWQVPHPSGVIVEPEINLYLIVSDGQGLAIDCGSSEAAVTQGISDVFQSLGVHSLIGVVATHHHRDHTAGVPGLSAAWNAPMYIHPLDAAPGADAMHVSSSCLREIPSRFTVGQLVVTVEHQPGHTHGHVHLRIPKDRVILVGDHLSGTGTVWIGPPDGHMDSYYAALANIMHGDCTVAGPGHGPPLQNAMDAARITLARRQRRASQILALTQRTEHSIDRIVETLYGNSLHPDIRKVARRTIQGHLEQMLNEGLVTRRFIPDIGLVYKSTSVMQESYIATRF